MTHDMRFTMYRGDTKKLNVAVVDETGAPVDISDATSVTFGIFEVDTGAVVAILVTGVEVTVSGSVITVVIPILVTQQLLGNYRYEIEVVTVEAHTYTVLQGTMTVVADLITPQVTP